VVYAAALPEMGDMGRSCASLSREMDGRLLLSVEGEDISALRAAVNSYLRIIMIAEEMQEVLK
jgi:KEOPS complex subunit Pcc1